MPWYSQEQVDEMKRLDEQLDVQFKCMAVFALVFMFMFGWAINREVNEKRQLQSECIRLGYGERDTDGNFVLKEK